MKILVVDDDRIALELLEISLRCAGHTNVDFCLSAEEALSMINHNGENYDCMLFDIMMPDVNGVELCRMVRSMKEYASIPIIMITAVNDQRMLEGAIEVGATDYLNKPFDGLELRVRLRTAALLNEAMKHPSEVLQTDMALREKPDVPLLELEDAFHLEPKPNLVGQTSLWYELIEQDTLPQTTHLFAMAIVDAPRIFSALPNETFREFINELSNAFVKALHQWRPRVTYYGDGVLLIALLNAAPNPLKEIQEQTSASISQMPLVSLGNYSKPVELWFQHVEPSGQKEQRSVDALRALLGAGTEAKSSALEQQTGARQNALRSEIIWRQEPKEIMSWKMSLTGARQRIKPRRVTRRTKTSRRMTVGQSAQ